MRNHQKGRANISTEKKVSGQQKRTSHTLAKSHLIKDYYPNINLLLKFNNKKHN